MLTTACIIVFFLSTIAFRKVNKLPITAIIPIWMFSILIFGFVVHSFFTNLHNLSKPMSADPYTAFLVLHNLELPISLLFILNFYFAAKRSLRAAVLILGSLALFAGETAAERIGVFKYSGWHPGLSPFLWFALICAVLALYRFMDADFVSRGERRF